MKSRKLILSSLVLLLASGCTSVLLAPERDDAEAKQFKPVPDKAVVYVYRDQSYGGGAKLDVYIDGVHKGQTAPFSYFRFYLSQGIHTISYDDDASDATHLDLVAGHVYYVRQQVNFGIWSPNPKMMRVDERAGQAGVRECKLAWLSDGTGQ